MNAPARLGYPTKARIEQAVGAAKAAGLDVGGIEVSPDGRIKIIDTRAMPKAPQNDFERWEGEL